MAQVAHLLQMRSPDAAQKMIGPSFRDGPNGSAQKRGPMTGSGPDPESRDSGLALCAPRN